ncbi:MAG: hypothetical protein KGV44_06775 [Flavobacteriaceae bacterium]|nr:hypothetical protein [Flavobacteriaceae bacterium]
MLKRIFGKKPYQPKITVEQFNEVFEWSKLAKTIGRGGFSKVIQDIEISSIDINHERIAKHKEYSYPAHLQLSNMPFFIHISVVDNAIEYRFNTIGKSCFNENSVTTDEKYLKIIDDFFAYFYTEIFGLPQSLEKLRNKSRQPKLNRKNKMLFLEKYLTSEDENFFEDYFCENADIYKIAMWIDWKECDEDIIKCCADVLLCKDLSVEVDEDIPENRGVDVYIIYKGVKTKVIYEEDKTSIDRTLITLNKVINEDYEIRRCIESDADTMCFLPLTHKQWERLEKKYPTAVAEKFEKITDDSYFWCE